MRQILDTQLLSTSDYDSMSKLSRLVCRASLRRGTQAVS